MSLFSRSLVSLIVILFFGNFGLNSLALAEPHICGERVRVSEYGYWLEFHLCDVLDTDAAGRARYEGSGFEGKGVSLVAYINVYRDEFNAVAQRFRCSGWISFETIDWQHHLRLERGANRDTYQRLRHQSSTNLGICQPDKVRRNKRVPSWINIRERLKTLRIFFYEYPFKIYIPFFAMPFLIRNDRYYFQIQVRYNGNTSRISGVHFTTEEKRVYFSY